MLPNRQEINVISIQLAVSSQYGQLHFTDQTNRYGFLRTASLLSWVDFL